MENYTPSHPVSPVSQPPSSPSSLKRYELGLDLSDKAIEIEAAAHPTPNPKAPRLSLIEVPRRKPVPPPKAAFVDPTEPHVEAPPAYQSGGGLKRKMRDLWLLRRKTVLIVAAVAAVLLLALIIGLAVGLTRHKTANLPLPTNNGGPYRGDLTYYDPGLGACGISSSSSQAVCAVSKELYDAASAGPNPNNNPLCGLKLRLRRNNKSVDVTVVDRCVGCKPTDIDVSIAVFEQLALEAQGRVDVEWAWLDKAPVNL
ncbi:riboflavin aldehyde-forming enzyme [Nannizzia gypsea CBS 118893]|uniref:Riboflavin aldehyde-forming enzyme n=1 Tax=Arthroderma gypseum (strain ATCC MYA-4604 / CBS 118893) TaxID=535722 RepID=E4UNI0_ARTGP|nr:riboflavin aldehyde-forming enzyme [Nannizzia gypsea CBS 118893]EFQ99588.1 riboflavin aldehyde-forming enzyme [Nannizzia gypsea CBS 118893]